MQMQMQMQTQFTADLQFKSATQSFCVKHEY